MHAISQEAQKVVCFLMVSEVQIVFQISGLQWKMVFQIYDPANLTSLIVGLGHSCPLCLLITREGAQLINTSFSRNDRTTQLERPRVLQGFYAI